MIDLDQPINQSSLCPASSKLVVSDFEPQDCYSLPVASGYRSSLGVYSGSAGAATVTSSKQSSPPVSSVKQHPQQHQQQNHHHHNPPQAEQNIFQSHFKLPVHSYCGVAPPAKEQVPNHVPLPQVLSPSQPPPTYSDTMSMLIGSRPQPTSANNKSTASHHLLKISSPMSAAKEDTLSKKKKKSHLSRDELARVCQLGEVTFEAYNGSTYMIAIRSLGDRKSLIGYRCDWNNCGYMNARVERMFGHIRSQHPEAPTVKKLVTSTSTATTTTMTTTTAASSASSAGANSAAVSACTSVSSSCSTVSSVSSNSQHSLRSSSSMSTSSSSSSSALSPRSSSKRSITPSSSLSSSSSSSTSSSSSSSSYSSSVLNQSMPSIAPPPTAATMSPLSSTPAIESSSQPLSTASSGSFQQMTPCSQELMHVESSPAVPSPSSLVISPVTRTSPSVLTCDVRFDNEHDEDGGGSGSGDHQNKSGQSSDSLLIDTNLDSILTGDSNVRADKSTKQSTCDMPIDSKSDSSKLMDLLTSTSGHEETETNNSLHQQRPNNHLNQEDLLKVAEPLSSSTPPPESTQEIMDKLKSISNEYCSNTTGPSDHFCSNATAANSAGSMVDIDRNNNSHRCDSGDSVEPTAAVQPSHNAVVPSHESTVSKSEPVADANSRRTDNTLQLFDEDDIESLLFSPISRPNPNQEDIHCSNSLKHCPDSYGTSHQTMLLDKTNLDQSIEPNGSVTMSTVNGLDHQNRSMDNYDLYPGVNHNSHHHYSSSSASSYTGDKLMTSNENSLYDNDSSFDVSDCVPMTINDGSNSSNSGEHCPLSAKSRTKRATNSKNYIGKQNLFQEFQSEDVTKIRDSENKYIIALQKDLKIVGYRCDWPECEFLTCRKYVMVNHINGKHTNQRPYSCPLCNFNFVKRYFLKAHMHKVHKRRIGGGELKGKSNKLDLDLDDYEDELMGLSGVGDIDAMPVAGHKLADHRPADRSMAMSKDYEQNDRIRSANKKFKSQHNSQHHPSTPHNPQQSHLNIPNNGSMAYHGAQSNGYYAGQSGDIGIDPYASAAYNGYGSQNGFLDSANSMYMANNGHKDNHGIPFKQQYPLAYNNGFSDSLNAASIGQTGFYMDSADSYGSDASTPGTVFKNGLSGGCGPTTGPNCHNASSAVFMTPSPSIASPLPPPFPGSTTPNNNKSFGYADCSPNSFDNCTGQPYSNTTPMNRSVSSAGATFGSQQNNYNGSPRGASAKGVSNQQNSLPMGHQVELLTPPLSVNLNGSAAGLSNSIHGGSCSQSHHQSQGDDMFCQSNLFPVVDHSQQQQQYSSSSMRGSYDEQFLSPPSSISSTNSSNYGGAYAGNSVGGTEASQQHQTVQGASRSPALAGSRTPSNSSTVSAMVNSSSFYLHTPSPSPSSLSHSPATNGPTYANGATTPYQTNFHNTTTTFANGQTREHTPTDPYQNGYKSAPYSNTSANKAASAGHQSMSLSLSVHQQQQQASLYQQQNNHNNPHHQSQQARHNSQQQQQQHPNQNAQTYRQLMTNSYESSNGYQNVANTFGPDQYGSGAGGGDYTTGFVSNSRNSSANTAATTNKSFAPDLLFNYGGGNHASAGYHHHHQSSLGQPNTSGHTGAGMYLNGTGGAGSAPASFLAANTGAECWNASW